MTIRAKIISETGEPLDGASVTLVNSKGQYLGEGVKTDATGKFALTSNFLSGNYFEVSYTGMIPLMLDPADYTGTEYKEIELFAGTLEPVTVTPKKDIGNNAWLLLLLVVGIALASRKK